MKWKGHIARLEDNRWTKRITEWQPYLEKDQDVGKKRDGRMV